jgi:hypothetical protein
VASGKKSERLLDEFMFCEQVLQLLLVSLLNHHGQQVHPNPLQARRLEGLPLLKGPVVVDDALVDLLSCESPEILGGADESQICLEGNEFAHGHGSVDEADDGTEERWLKQATIARSEAGRGSEKHRTASIRTTRLFSGCSSPPKLFMLMPMTVFPAISSATLENMSTP